MVHLLPQPKTFLPIIGKPILELDIWVPGRPSQWSRGSPFKGKSGKVFIAKTDKDRKAQGIIRQVFFDWLRLNPDYQHYFPWGSAVRLCSHAFYKLPKNAQNKQGFKIQEKTSAPDASNLVKQIEDSFNTLDGSQLPTPYFDDAMITQIYGTKHWHPYVEGVAVNLELWLSEPVFVKWEDFPNQYEEYEE